MKRFSNLVAGLILIMGLAGFLWACTDGTHGGNQSGVSMTPSHVDGWTDPDPTDGQTSPVMIWQNLAFDTINAVYDYTPPTITPQDMINYGQMASTTDSVCVVTWSSVGSLYCGCRSTTLDGQWPVISAPTSVGNFFLSSLGASRPLSAEETLLCDSIRDATYCTAPRVDGLIPDGCGAA